MRKPNGEIVLAKARLAALAQAQDAFAAGSVDLGASNEDWVQWWPTRV